MSSKNNARRTELKLYFKGVDISKDISDYLQSMSYTDNEKDKTDDISITLDDRDEKWLTKWLNTKNATKKAVGSKKDISVGDIVQFKGGSVYVSSTAVNVAANKGASKCKVTMKNNNKHPLHLVSQDGKKVYGWVDTKDVEETANNTKNVKERRAFKGAEIHAVIIQNNPLSDGKDKLHDCGVFEIDSVGFSGPPDKLTIKATSIPYSSTLRQTRKSKVWENTTLKNIGNNIAKNNGFQLMYLSSDNPKYKRKEQLNSSDIAFLKKLCKKEEISLKVTSKTIVMFDAAEYEKKKETKKLKKGKGNILSYKLDTKTVDTEYSKCTVSYTNPKDKKTISASYAKPGADKKVQELKINEKVHSKDEALKLAKKYLREKNKGETTAQFTLVGDVDYCAGITVMLYGFGEFDGKYMVETATHNLTGGYTVDLKLRRCLED